MDEAYLSVDCSSSVIDHIKIACNHNAGIALAYFFFDFNDEAKQNTDNMLSSCITQLCSRRPDTPSSVEALKEYKAKAQRPETKELESMLAATVEGFSQVYLVIDALDECPLSKGERGKLLQVLLQLQQRSLSTIHVLCTSRRERDIEAALGALIPSPTKSIINLHNCEDGVSRDIESFVNLRLTSSSSPCRSWPPALKEKVRLALNDKADDM